MLELGLHVIQAQLELRSMTPSGVQTGLDLFLSKKDSRELLSALFGAGIGGLYSRLTDLELLLSLAQSSVVCGRLLL